MRRLVLVLGVLVTMVAGGAAIAQGPSPAGDVVVANAYASADALTGGPLASRLGAPLLTVRQDAIPEATLRQLRSLQPARVIVLGGEVVIGQDVEEQLQALEWNPVVRRLGGETRFDTAERIARFLAEQPLPAAGSLAGVTLDELITEDELDSVLGTSSDPIEQVVPMPTSNDDRQTGPWVTTGPVRTRLVCEPDVSGLPEVTAQIEMRWTGDGVGHDDPFSGSFAYVNGSQTSDITSLVAGMTGTDGDAVVQATSEGWMSINLTTDGSCHGVWSVVVRPLPTSG